jgi:pyruvate formate lyase activating enzyme
VDNETTIDHSLHSPDFDQVLKYRQILEQYVKHVEIRRN